MNFINKYLFTRFLTVNIDYKFKFTSNNAMQILIIFLISSLLNIPARASVRTMKDIDSMMVNLSHPDKVKSLLWVEASSLSDINRFPSHKHFFVTNEMEDEILKPLTNLTLARRLDVSLNPSSSQELPDLSYLATITEEDLLKGYFQFLRSLGLALNYQYLILPTTDNLREQAVIRKLQQFDPDYFIDPTMIHSGVPKKKEAKTLFDHHDFWLVGADSYARAESMIEKLDDKLLLPQKDQLIRNALIGSFVDNRSAEPLMSNRLRMELLKSSVALIETRPFLPLARDTVCFISQNPYGDMANMLRKYAYVITDLEEIFQSTAPVISDYNPMLPGYFGERAIIYIGTMDQFDPKFFNAGLIIPHEEDEYSYIIPQQLFGAIPVSGAITHNYHVLDGFENRSLQAWGKLGFAPSHSVGLNQKHLDSIRSIIKDGILQNAFPGCQLAMAVGGSVIFNETFGHLTYDQLIPVYPSTIFDLASVTKVASTLMMAMKLYEDQQLDIHESISHYLPRYAASNKKDITIKSLMSHQAGLLPYVPFWKRVLSGDFLDPFYYASPKDELMDQRSYGIEPSSLLRDSLSQWILTSSLLKYDSVPYYSYSDIGFMILQEILEEIAGESMDTYLNNHFYKPLGLHRTSFNPKKSDINLFEIAPTEYDSYYRSEQIWGDVHDRNAAILDGVAGHAGLFSNARDMLVLFQMILQGGSYGGERFISQETLDVFNQRYFPDNRRGLGWDKKSEIVRNVSLHASDESFGHTGFTGTMVWVDPQYELVFVFLSNRIHPNANNRKLNELDIRTKIQDIVYEAIQAKIGD